MAGISTATKTAMYLLAGVVLTQSAARGDEFGEFASAAQNAAWSTTADVEPAIEQVQFGGFLPRVFGRPAVTNLPPSRESAAPQPAPPRQLLASAPATPRRQRLARAPDMLGDTFLPPAQLFVVRQESGNNNEFISSQIPVAGGSARAKISENNKALPVDRVFFNYNHFHNAVQRDVAGEFGDQIRQSANVDRFTIGAERTILNGNASFGIRLPLTNYPDLDTTLPGFGSSGRFKSYTGTVGNLSVIGKRLLVNAEDLVVSCGLGLELPTGADGSVLSGTTLFNVQNESLFLQPFLAMTLDNGTVFVHSFLQVDVGLTGSPLVISDVTIPLSPNGVGELGNATLISWDTSAGVWLARSQDQYGVTGIAAISEFHMTSAVSSVDPLAARVPTQLGDADFVMTPSPNQFTAMYLTTGLHAEIGRARTIRVAGVFPLRRGVNRFFDAEVLVQFGSRY